MRGPVIERLSVVAWPGGELRLRRAWPRGSGHLLLEYGDARGGLVAGQWMAEVAALRRVAGETAKQSPGARPVLLEAQGVLLQPRGGDRKLVGLAALLSLHGATLLSHRPERRAVVRLDGAPGRFAKVLRPSRVAEAIASARSLLDQPGLPFALPRILEADEACGVVTWSALGGASLHDQLGERGRLVPAARTCGCALRALHALPAPVAAPTHDARAEAALLREQLALLEDLDPTAHRLIAGAGEGVLGGLDGEPCGEATLHRDLHDKQVLIDGRGRPGLLDLDTLARGEPALDLGNMLAHFELRVMQGRCAPVDAAAAAEAFLEGYRPSEPVLARIPAYRSATLLRLACVYSYRPHWRRLGPGLAEAASAAPARTSEG
jgi:aminoglycoside phosphotransferase (APT) family kinase protein